MSKKRLQILQDLLKKKSWDALLLEDPLSLLYLTGVSVSAGQLLISEKNALLIVDGRYIETAETKSACPVALRSEEIVKSTLAKWDAQIIAISSQDTSYFAYINWVEALPEFHIEPARNPVHCLREIKDPEEQNRLRQAAQLGSAGYDLVVQLLKEGISEQEVAMELELFWLRHGGKGPAFQPIIAFGPNTSKPHYTPSDAKLAAHQPVLIDIGVTLNNYHSDMTRVVFFKEPSDPLREIYQVVQEAQQAALDLCLPGTRIGDLDQAARNHIQATGYGEYFPHSLGHGIGLEVHEAPTIRNRGALADATLVPGMVLTIEPGVYLPGIGGVRIEDTLLITETGYEDLTQRSKDLLIL